MNKEYTIRQAAVLVALASALQVLESFFPHPVPGVKLGLANIITMIALVRIGARAAVEISILRVIISAMFTGTIFTPAFFIGLSGAVCSSAVMAAVYKATAERGRVVLSMTGISVLGAAVHNAVQLAVVYFVFIKSPAVVSFAPFLGLSAVAAGLVTGAVASAAVKAANSSKVYARQYPAVTAAKENSICCSVPLRIAALLAADTAVLLSSGPRDFVLTAAGLVLASLLLRGSILNALKAVRKMAVFIVISFLVPFLFGGAAQAMTYQSAAEGAVYGARIAMLIAFASVLLRGVDWSKSAQRGVFSARPFKILAGSYAMLPQVIENVKISVKESFSGGNRLNRAFETIGISVASLYTSAKEDTKT